MNITLEIFYSIKQPHHLGVAIKQRPQSIKIELSETRTQMIHQTTDKEERAELLRRWAEDVLNWVELPNRYKVERIKAFGERNTPKISALCLF